MLGYESVLQIMHFIVVRSAVGELVSPGYSVRLPLTVSQVLSTSAFCGRSEQTKRVYVASFVLGTSLYGMKKKVLVHLTRPLTPWARRPNSLAADKVHFFFVFGLLMSSLYSMIFPVSGSKIDPANDGYTNRAFGAWTNMYFRGVSGVYCVGIG